MYVGFFSRPRPTGSRERLFGQKHFTSCLAPTGATRPRVFEAFRARTEVVETPPRLSFLSLSLSLSLFHAADPPRTTRPAHPTVSPFENAVVQW